MSRIFDFGGGSFPLAATASRSSLPPLAYCGAIKCMNHGLHGWHGLEIIRNYYRVMAGAKSIYAKKLFDEGFIAAIWDIDQDLTKK